MEKVEATPDKPLGLTSPHVHGNLMLLQMEKVGKKRVKDIWCEHEEGQGCCTMREKQAVYGGTATRTDPCSLPP